jgi:hypothetical protein
MIMIMCKISPGFKLAAAGNSILPGAAAAASLQRLQWTPAPLMGSAAAGPAVQHMQNSLRRGQTKHCRRSKSHQGLVNVRLTYHLQGLRQRS